MANPTIQVTYDKVTYAPGDPIIATVHINDPDTGAKSDVWQAVDAAGNTAEITVARNVVDPLIVTPPAGFVKTSNGNGSPQTWRGTA